MVFKFIILDEIMKGIIIDKGLRVEFWSILEFRSYKNKEE